MVFGFFFGICFCFVFFGGGVLFYWAVSLHKPFEIHLGKNKLKGAWLRIFSKNYFFVYKVNNALVRYLY